MKHYSTNPVPDLEQVPFTDDYFATRSSRLFRFDGEGFCELQGWIEEKKSGDRYRRDWIHVRSEAGYTWKKVYRHSTIAMTFIGPKPGNCSVVCHGPGGSLENCVENLKWGTYYENNVVDRMKGPEYWERWKSYLEFDLANDVDLYAGYF